MNLAKTKPTPQVWSVAEAKARLSELLRRANDSPQFIDTKKSYVLISPETWQALSQAKPPLGQWLVERMARVGELELPARKEPERLVVKLLNKAGKFSL